MNLKISNRNGPISFRSASLRNSKNSSIENLINNVSSLSLTDISLSSSYSTIKSYSGDSITDERKSEDYAKIGYGLYHINTTDNNYIAMGRILGANYISASFKMDPGNSGDGICEINVDASSFIPNVNYFTNQTQSNCYLYSQYSRNISDTEFTKSYSYVVQDLSKQYFGNLTTNKVYKFVVKDMVSNAFTSSIFTGTCSETTTMAKNSIFVSSTNKQNLKIAKEDIKSTLSNYYNTGKINQIQYKDLINILDKIETIVNNPNSFTKTENYRSFNSSGVTGTREYRIRGFIGNVSTNGRYFSGVIDATLGGSGGNTPYTYVFERVVSTLNISCIHVHLVTPKTITNVCETIPTNYLGSVFGSMACNYPSQANSIITNPTDVRLTGSFLIYNPTTNSNITNLTISLDDFKNKENGGTINFATSYIKPNLSDSNFTLDSGERKKISIKFGESYWGNTLQSSSINVEGFGTATFEGGGSVSFPIKVIMDKNSCILSSTNNSSDKKSYRLKN